MLPPAPVGAGNKASFGPVRRDDLKPTACSHAAPAAFKVKDMAPKAKTTSADSSSFDFDEKAFAQKIKSIGESLSFEQFMELKDFKHYVPHIFDLEGGDRKRALRLRQIAAQALLDADYHKGISFLNKSLSECVTAPALKALAAMRARQSKFTEALYLLHLYKQVENNFEDEDEDLDEFIALDLPEFESAHQVYRELSNIAQRTYLNLQTLMMIREYREDLNHAQFIRLCVQGAVADMFRLPFADETQVYFLLRELNNTPIFDRASDYPGLDALYRKIKIPSTQELMACQGTRFFDMYLACRGLYNIHLSYQYYYNVL